MSTRPFSMLPGGEPLRLLVCDDHALFRRSMVTALEDVGYWVVAEAETGTEAIELAQAHVPDVIVMDLRMPAGSGTEATAAISRRSPWTPILVLTVSDDLDEIAAAILAGAMGHLGKEEAMAVLPNVIRDLFDGGVHIGPALARRLGADLVRIGERPSETWRPKPVQVSLLDGIAEGWELDPVAARAGISPHAARTELRAALVGLHRASRRP